MLPIFISVFASAIFLAIALVIVRQRLGRQFSDIQRRLIEAEKMILALRLKEQGDTTAEQLKRLHAGLIRVQENIAYHRKLGHAAQRDISDLETVGLREWTSALGSPLSEEQIRKCARAAGNLEAALPEDVSLSTPDLVAVVVALRAMNRQRISVACVGARASSLAPLLSAMSPAFFEEVKVQEPVVNGVACDALVIDAEESGIESALESVMTGGLVIMTGGEEGRDFSGFAPVASAFGMRAYRKTGES